MSVVGNLSRHLHFAEFNDGLETNAGYMSPAARKAAARANLGVAASGDPVSSDNVTVAAFTGGGVTFTGGTLTEALQAIADATPAA